MVKKRELMLDKWMAGCGKSENLGSQCGRLTEAIFFVFSYAILIQEFTKRVDSSLWASRFLQEDVADCGM
jgi:hypothetical protein